MPVGQTEQLTMPERKFSAHQEALEKIVRPNHLLTHNTIFKQLQSGEITLEEAQHQEEELLIKIASTDHMTGLDNPRGAELKLTQLIDYCTQNNIPLIGMYLDGDNFKLINDMFGHDIGNIVILLLTRGINKGTRPSDIKTQFTTKPTNKEQSSVNEKESAKARLGGDEFFIALPGATLKETPDIFARITDHFAKITDRLLPDYKKQVGSSMTITAGAVQYTPELDQNPSGFIKRCERTMQNGKETHKGALTIATLPLQKAAIKPNSEAQPPTVSYQEPVPIKAG